MKGSDTRLKPTNGREESIMQTIIKVTCRTADIGLELTPADMRLVYFTDDVDGPHAAWTCPTCTDEHRNYAPVFLLDQIRDAGAVSDWPTVPDDASALLTQ